MSLIIQLMLGSLLFVGVSYGCLGGVDPKEGTQNFFGEQFKLEPIPDGRTGEAISQYEQLTCTYDQTCRWGNQDRGAGDSLWYLATGEANEATWVAQMGVDAKPDPPFVIIPISATSTDANIDWYTSELFNCAQPFLMMVFNYWVSKSVTFQVCAIADGTERKIWCSEKISQTSEPKSPGPFLLEISQPITEPFRLSFIPSAGLFGHVAIDEIQVYTEDTCAVTTPAPTTTLFITTTTPMPTTPPPQVTTTTEAKPDPECTAVPCDFEFGICSFNPNDARGGRSYIGVRDYTPTIGNSRTTMVMPDQANKIQRQFLGAEVTTGQMSVASTPKFQVTRSRYFKLRFYQATYAGRIRVCYDSNLSACEVVDPDFSGNTQVLRGQWRDWQGQFEMRPNTDYRVFVVSDLNSNSAEYTGIGVDNFGLSGC